MYSFCTLLYMDTIDTKTSNDVFIVFKHLGSVATNTVRLLESPLPLVRLTLFEDQERVLC